MNQRTKSSDDQATQENPRKLVKAAKLEQQQQLNMHKPAAKPEMPKMPIQGAAPGKKAAAETQEGVRDHMTEQVPGSRRGTNVGKNVFAAALQSAQQEQTLRIAQLTGPRYAPNETECSSLC